MLHPGRCGSTVLGSLVNQHQDMFWAGESFLKYHSDKSLTISEMKKVLATSESIKLCKYYMFATKYPRGMDLSENCVDMSIPEYIEFLKKQGYSHFVFLERENYLSRAISMEKGRKSGVWHLKNNEQQKFSGKLHLDVNSFQVGMNEYIPLLQYFENLDNEKKLILDSLSGYPVLELTYEKDIEENPRNAYNKYCNFLDVKPVEVKIELKKTSRESMKDLISNYQDVYEAIKPTKYGWMLD